MGSNKRLTGEQKKKRESHGGHIAFLTCTKELMLRANFEVFVGYSESGFYASWSWCFIIKIFWKLCM